MKIIISIDNNTTIITLPYVLEGGYNIDYGASENEEVNSIYGKVITSLGADPLTRVSIKGEFPLHKEQWMETDTLEPLAYTEFLRSNRELNKVFRLVITRDNGDCVFNKEVVCTALKFDAPKINGDTPYEIEFTEYIRASTLAIPNEKKPKPSKSKKVAKKKKKTSKKKK